MFIKKDKIDFLIKSLVDRVNNTRTLTQKVQRREGDIQSS